MTIHSKHDPYTDSSRDRKGRSSKKDKYKNKNLRNRAY